jgi:hypothetical protein
MMRFTWLSRFQRSKVEEVMGHRISEPRPTLWAAFWVIVYLIVPVLLLGMLIDLLIQGVTGHCVGLWCWL